MTRHLNVGGVIRTGHVALLLSLLLLGACTPGGQGEDPVRTVRNAPIERLEYLGVAEEAYWVNEETKEGGPEGKWQSGVARLEAEDFREFRYSQEWQPVTTSPIIPGDVQGRLTFGDEWRMGETDHGVFYLESGTHSVVFSVRD